MLSHGKNPMQMAGHPGPQPGGLHRPDVRSTARQPLLAPARPGRHPLLPAAAPFRRLCSVVGRGRVEVLLELGLCLVVHLQQAQQGRTN